MCSLDVFLLVSLHSKHTWSYFFIIWVYYNNSNKYGITNSKFTPYSIPFSSSYVVLTHSVVNFVAIFIDSSKFFSLNMLPTNVLVKISPVPW